ncbi:hypothetical protein LSH36_91g06000, partial [Paralvinella palmiformis]
MGVNIWMKMAVKKILPSLSTGWVVYVACLCLLLVSCMKLCSPEILFACHSHTTQPLNGLPFYQILDDQLTYREAQRECWTL